MHRTSEGGTYRIDRRFKGVGRIARASGATTRTEFRKRDAFLTWLHEKGRHDVLQTIKDGKYTVTEVYAASREDRLEELMQPTTEKAILGRPLWDAVEAWLDYPVWADEDEDYERPDPTHRRYGVSFKALKSYGPLDKGATVEDLDGTDWKRLKADWPNSDTDWFHLRAAVSKFLTDQFEDVHHPFRRKVVKKIPKTKTRERVPDLTAERFWKIVNEAPDWVRPAYVTMAALGLRVGEYLALEDTDLMPHTHQVRIPGTKTQGSATVLRVDERLWPWVKAGVPSPLKYGWLRKYWVRARKAVGADDIQLKDLRHLPAMLLTEAGRSEASVQTTMRHATPSMTRRYAMQKDRGVNARVLADELLPTGTDQQS